MQEENIRTIADHGYTTESTYEKKRRILSQSEEFTSCEKCIKDPLEASRTIAKLRLLVLEEL